MKTVVTPSEVAHFWANQLQDNARTANRNFYFDGKVIYSYGYHFPIAKHVTNERNESAILFTERHYSVSTSRHISIVAQAANHIEKIYCYNPTNTAQDNFSHWLTEAETIAANLLKAKKPEIYLNKIEAVKAKAEKYAAFFSIPIPESLAIALSISNKQEFSEYQAKKDELNRRQKEKAEKELAKRHKKELADWLAGKTNRLYVRDGFDYLRIGGDSVETPQGVTVPMNIALKTYEKLKADKLKVGDSVMEFTVKKMNGDVKIGCHNFKKSYLLKFGAKLKEVVFN